MVHVDGADKAGDPGDETLFLVSEEGDVRVHPVYHDESKLQLELSGKLLHEYQGVLLFLGVVIFYGLDQPVEDVRIQHVLFCD